MKELFLNVLEISLSTSLIGLLLLLSSRILNRRYAAKWKYGIWILLALRLVLPFKLSLPQQQIVLDVPARLASPMASSVTAMAVAPDFTQTVAAESLSVLDVLAVLWLIGAAAFLLTHLLSYAHYRRTILRHGQRVTDIAILRQIRSISQELNLRRRMPVIQDITATSPMVVGFFRPILVTPGVDYEPMELYFVLKHELIHLMRHDMFSKLLFVAATAMHWFNPLVYLMQKEAVVDMELSCDERVVKGSVFETRKAYTETLLANLARQHKPATALSTQFFGDKDVMKKRFLNILTRAKKRNGIVVLVVILALVIGLGAFFGISADTTEIEEAQKMLQVGNDFLDAYVAGDRDAMRQYMADTYEGSLDIEPITDLSEARGINLYSAMKSGDLSDNLEDTPNVTSTNAPVGSTFTAVAKAQNKNAVDTMRFSFIKQEDGWKIRDYELVKNAGNIETVGEATAATEVQATEVGVPEDISGQMLEIGGIVGKFVNAYLADDAVTMGSVLAENYAGNTTPYSGPQPHVGSTGSMSYAPQPGDIGISEEDAVSIYNETVPMGSTITALYDMKDPEIRLFVYLTREERGWKVDDYLLYQNDTQQITKLAYDFTNAMYSGDKEFANSCMSVISSHYIDETWEDTRFLGIHAVKGVPTYDTPAEDEARASVSVELRQGEYAEDTYTYLELELIKELDGWKIYSYMMEG